VTRAVVAVVVWAAALAGAIALSSAVAGSVHDQQAQEKRKAIVQARTGHEVGRPATPNSAETTLGSVPPRPRHANRLSPVSPRSLFRAENFSVTLDVARHALGTRADVSAFALYPGEADFIVVHDDGRQLVRIDDDGDLVQGKLQPFSGSLSVIYLWQLEPQVPQRLARQIAVRAHVPTRRLDRFVMDADLHDSNAGWNIYQRFSPVRFQALLTGGDLQEVGPNGTRPLG
jgi:hypothetical protein